jgi:hypothetical protein
VKHERPKTVFQFGHHECWLDNDIKHEPIEKIINEVIRRFVVMHMYDHEQGSTSLFAVEEYGITFPETVGELSLGAAARVTRCDEEEVYGSPFFSTWQEAASHGLEEMREIANRYKKYADELENYLINHGNEVDA